MALVLLRRPMSSIEASIIRSRLGAEGIVSFIFDAEEQWDTLGSPMGVRLMVHEEDLELAAGVLKEIED